MYRCSGYYRVSVQQITYQLTDVLIKGMTVSQVLYASQAARYAFIHSARQKFYGKISVKCNNEVLLTVKEKITEPFVADKQYMIEFLVNKVYFDDLRLAVSSIPKTALIKIIPDLRLSVSIGKDPRINVPPTKYDFNSLDKTQSDGLQIILQAQPDIPVLVPTAFGTGKTRLLSAATEALVQLGKERKEPTRVLICYHHQTSADMLMKTYYEKMLDSKKYPWSVCVVRVTSQTHLMSSLYTSEKCRIMLVQEFRENFAVLRQKQKFIVVVTTYNGALKISKNAPDPSFTHIFIDEGEQSREPECVGSLALAGKDTKVVIFGDIQQVGKM